MSWTSPLTVARIYFCRASRVGFLHELLEVIHGGFHRFGGLQHFSDDQFVVVEQAAHFGHSCHQRAVDDVEWRRAFCALSI